jgi:ankyrin repeat protein
MVGFKYQNFVRLQGLTNASYNGKLARIECFSADNVTGRWRVELQVGQIAPNLSRKILVKPENMVRACDCCLLAGAATMQYCSRCKNAAYCNAECQRSDWKRHKAECSEMNSERQLVKSPLHLAAGSGNLAEVENLVRAGADVEKGSMGTGITPLHLAAANGHLAVVQFLLPHGADKDKATDDGVTPLYFAADGGHLAVVKYLVQQGADKDKATCNNTTPLFATAYNGHLAVMQYLVQRGADKNKAAINGATSLIAAAGEGHLALVQYLVQQGADVNQAADENLTPLLAAMSQGRIAVANYLHEQGARL